MTYLRCFRFFLFTLILLLSFTCPLYSFRLSFGIIRLADYFETSVDYLIGHTDIDHAMEAVYSYDLNEDEASLINNYRKLSKRQKKSIRLIIDNYIDM